MSIQNCVDPDVAAAVFYVMAAGFVGFLVGRIWQDYKNHMKNPPDDRPIL